MKLIGEYTYRGPAVKPGEFPPMVRFSRQEDGDVRLWARDHTGRIMDILIPEQEWVILFEKAAAEFGTD